MMDDDQLANVGFTLSFPYWVALLFALQDELSCLGYFAFCAVYFIHGISCLCALIFQYVCLFLFCRCKILKRTSIIRHSYR